MAAPTGSLFSTHGVRIEEIINKKIEMFLPTMDKVWEETIVSNQGVGSQDQIGRDFLIVKTYMGGLSGVIDPGGPGSDFTLYGDPMNTALGAKIHLQGLQSVFPDATLGPNATPYRLACPMRSMVTNLMLTLGELQAEATDAFIGEVVQPKLEGFAKNLTQYLCNYFYLSQNTYYSLSYLGNTTAGQGYSLEDSNKTIVLDTTYSNYAVDRFMVGMRVQWYDSTGATQRTVTSSNSGSTFIVTAVDELSGKVKMKEAGNLALNSTAFVSNLVANDIIVFANSKGSSSTPYSASPYFTGIAGINSWLKYGAGGDDNYLLGGERAGTNSGYSGDIDVTVHPEFRSMTLNVGGNPLTEHYLRKVLRRWHAAKGKYGQTIDCLIASDGVWLAYEAQKIGRQYYDRTGRRSSIDNEGSTGEFEFAFDGRTYTGCTSTWVDANTVYGIKKGGGNWKRYSPPDPRNVKKNEKLASWIPFRFVGSALTGTGSNQIPIFSIHSNRTFVTEGVQMPGFLRMQLVPEQPAGLRLTNVAEDRVYSA